jgi:hypothetical protein
LRLVLLRIDISSGSGVLLIGVRYKGHHLFERNNVKPEHRVVVFQLIPNRVDGVIKLKVNVMVFRPALQKPQHSQTTTFDCSDFRQIKHHDSDILLRRDNLAQLQGSIAPHDSSLTLNNGHASNVFDPQGQHDAS